MDKKAIQNADGSCRWLQPTKNVGYLAGKISVSKHTWLDVKQSAYPQNFFCAFAKVSDSRGAKNRRRSQTDGLGDDSCDSSYRTKAGLDLEITAKIFAAAHIRMHRGALTRLLEFVRLRSYLSKANARACRKALRGRASLCIDALLFACARCGGSVERPR